MPDWRPLLAEKLSRLGLRPEREIEIVEELAQQLEGSYRDARARGLSEPEAREAALGQFPDWEAFLRDLRLSETPFRSFDPIGKPERGGFLPGIWQDVRFSARQLARNPGFAAIAVATLAIGIGACTAIYGLLDAVVLRPLEYRDAEALVMIWETFPARNARENVVSPANFLDWRQRSRVFSEMAAVIDGRRTLVDREPEDLNTQAVSAPFFPMLGVRALIGRTIEAEDDRPGAPRVAVLSHGLWLRKFGGDPDITGRAISLDGEPATVIGVLPPGFRSLGNPPDLWMAARLDPARNYRKGSGRYMRAAAKLREGASLEQAQAEMSGIARQLEQEFAEFDKGWGVNLVPLREQFAAGARTGLWMLAAAVALVLLIACANVSNLLLARGAEREREVAIRMSMGAARGRVVRQLLTESGLLGVTGAAAGCGLAYWGIRAVQIFGPERIPRLDSAGLDLRVLAFAFTVTLGAVLFFGAAPALAAARAPLVSSLKEGGRGSGPGVHGRRWSSLLVVSQIALSLVLLVSAGLLLRSYARLSEVSPGFDASRVLTATVSLPQSRYPDADKITSFFTLLNERIGALPGVVAASSITFLPFSGPAAATGYYNAAAPEPPPGQVPVCDVRVVQPGYLKTMRIPLLQGRDFYAADNQRTAPLRFLINAALAKEHFAGKNPIGQRLRVHMGPGQPPGEIVGIVGDTRHEGLSGDIRPMVYYPQAHLPIGFMSLVVRTSGDPMALAGPVIQAVREMDRELPASDVRSMESWIARTLAAQRFQTSVLTTFSGIALALTLVGIYGAVSVSVARRTREIGVRLALGAAPGDVLRWMLGQGLTLAGIGLAAGLAAALAATRLLRSVLYSVSPTDPLTFLGTAALLGSVSLAAIWIPARRAMRVDPLVAMRAE